MLTALLLSAYCLSLVGSLSIDLTPAVKYIDGTQLTIKSVATTYIQRVDNEGRCSVELQANSEPAATLREGELVKIINKWFKVEDCRLNRAYPVPCGSKLFYQLRDVTCSVLEQHTADDDKVPVRRPTKVELTQALEQSSSKPCCESACTVSEFIRYCPSNW